MRKKLCICTGGLSTFCVYSSNEAQPSVILQYFLFKLSFAVPLKKAINNHSHLRTGLDGFRSHFVSS